VTLDIVGMRADTKDITSHDGPRAGPN
jgi:hypothetical protein